MDSTGTPPKSTLADVARQAGVSAMTVSRVVNGQAGVGEGTRKQFERAICELDYRPNSLARSLKASRSNNIGLMVPDITNPYFPEIVRGAADVALAAGCAVVLNNVIEDPTREAATLRVFEERRVDGVLICSSRLPAAKLHALLERVPELSRIRDDGLSELLQQDDARQVLHVTFGSVLDGYKEEIMNVLSQHEEAHYQGLARHFERHLEPFAEVIA